MAPKKIGPVCHLGLRDHAPADARGGRHPVFPTLDGAFPDDLCSGRSLSTGCSGAVGGAGLLWPSAQSPPGCQDRDDGVWWAARWGPGKSPAPARDRPLHLRGDRFHRFRL